MTEPTPIGAKPTRPALLARPLHAVLDIAAHGDCEDVRRMITELRAHADVQRACGKVAEAQIARRFARAIARSFFARETED